ncbi:MAG: hypothetical protein ACM3U2_24585 [Deltaproteobacteria bacterium]
MPAHNAWIYHCQRCGNVAHRKNDDPAPLCCDRLMARAAGETMYEPNLQRHARKVCGDGQPICATRDQHSVAN